MNLINSVETNMMINEGSLGKLKLLQNEKLIFFISLKKNKEKLQELDFEFGSSFICSTTTLTF